MQQGFFALHLSTLLVRMMTSTPDELDSFAGESFSSTPPCCPAWPDIRTAIAWFVLERDLSVRVLPHLIADDDRPVHDRMIRLMHCPSCGADRHMAIWNLDQP